MKLKTYRVRFTNDENRAVRSLTTVGVDESEVRQWAKDLLARREHPDQVEGRVVLFQRVELDWSRRTEP